MSTDNPVKWWISSSCNFQIISRIIPFLPPNQKREESNHVGVFLSFRKVSFCFVLSLVLFFRIFVIYPILYHYKYCYLYNILLYYCYEWLIIEEIKRCYWRNKKKGSRKPQTKTHTWFTQTFFFSIINIISKIQSFNKKKIIHK